MRIGNINQGRPAYYDRNAFTQGQSYNVAGIAPHGVTTRWTFTVPSNQKAYVQACVCKLMRDGVAAPVGTALAQIDWGCDVGGAAFAAFACVLDNTMGARDNSNVGQTGLMTPGNTLTGSTADFGTGGSFLYELSAVIARFDS